MSDAECAAQARARKAVALLAQLDQHSALAGLRPLRGEEGAKAAAEFLRPFWYALAIQAGVKPPSQAAIDIVIEHIRHRGEMRKATPPRGTQLSLAAPRRTA